MVKKPGHVEIHVSKTSADIKMKHKINQNNNQKKTFSQFPNISPQSPLTIFTFDINTGDRCTQINHRVTFSLRLVGGTSVHVHKCMQVLTD